MMDEDIAVWELFSKAILIYVALKTASKQLADQTSTFFSLSSAYIPQRVFLMK